MVRNPVVGSQRKLLESSFLLCSIFSRGRLPGSLLGSSPGLSPWGAIQKRKPGFNHAVHTALPFVGYTFLRFCSSEINWKITMLTCSPPPDSERTCMDCVLLSLPTTTTKPERDPLDDHSLDLMCCRDGSHPPPPPLVI